jgi:TatD DNase family protein
MNSHCSLLTMLLLPFDAHNHVHLGPTPPLEQQQLMGRCLSGMAVMSTHPRDFPKVLELAAADSSILPCVGVHPWFLHELTEDDWKPTTTTTTTTTSTSTTGLPRWIQEMEELLIQHPHMPVGEIGLDNFHFDFHTKELTSPLATQVEALEHQLRLATKYERPVSVHCVRAMGKLIETLAKVQKQQSNNKLPPRIYFHAFGGKAATVTQLFKSLEKSTNKKTSSNTKVYFGFAPIVNFASPKTIEVVRTVGLERLVLETDHEDAARVPASMELGIQVLAEALEITREELILQTNRNAQDLYGLVDKEQELLEESEAQQIA